MSRKIDFSGINQSALNHAVRLLVDWLPGGDWSGDEYKPLNPTRNDRHKGSFVINSKTGKWIDNASGDSGGDLISLYQYIRFCDVKTAAADVAAVVGVGLYVGGVSGDQENYTARKAVAPRQPVQGGSKKKIESEHARSPWVAIMPVPDDAPAPPVAHYVRGKPDVVYSYLAADGRVNGYVYWFVASDGSKETMPVCYCKRFRCD